VSDPDQPELLSYAGPGAADPLPRLSAFAVTCFIASFAVCPCLMGALHRQIDPGAYRRTPRSAFTFAMLAFPALCVLIGSILSLVRIYRSRGRIWGTALSAWALVLCTIWLLLMIVVGLFLDKPVGNMH
jgi:hypothetical protein